MVTKGTVYLVGAGPGDPGLITRRGLDILRCADVVVYDRLVSPELLLEARPDARLVYVGKAAASHSLTQDEICQLLKDEAEAGRSVCRLKGGDPFLFARGGEEADSLAEAGIPFVVVPGVTSALAAPAYAGIPVTDRRVASSVVIATGHEDINKADSSVDWGRLAQAADTIVVLMGMKNLRTITSDLVAGGRATTTPAAVVRWGTTGRQQTLVSDLAKIADEVENRGLTAPVVLIVGDVVAMRERISWFDGRPLSGRSVLVARPRQGAGVLAELLRQSGAEPVVCPMIRVDPLPIDGPRIEVLMRQRWDWVLFTSANGVACFRRQLLSSGHDWRSLADARLGVIGPGTASALEGDGLRVDFVPSRAVAESFAAELPEVSRNTRVLLPRAANARSILPDRLQEKGASVEVFELYRAVPDEAGVSLLKSILDEGRIDVFAFASASTVHSVVDAVGGEAVGRGVVACIGPITANAARERGLTVDIEAKTHTIPGLVEALERHFAARETPDKDAKEGTR